VGVRNAARKFSIVFSLISPSRELPPGSFDDALFDKKMECPNQQVAEKSLSLLPPGEG